MDLKNNIKEWFGEWFDTTYYHTLYKHRDYAEAELFIRNLVDYLKPDKNKLIVDLACGKGRHSKFLNSLGFNVLGLDLSENSIRNASTASNETLTFGVHDMRKPLPNKELGYVFNLFTSFGYFDDDAEDLNVLKSVYEGLQPGGLMVLDFMNVQKVIKNLVFSETKELESINFKISRAVIDGFIVKKIKIEDQGDFLEFEERVKVIGLEKFINYFQDVGFQLVETFGDYELNPFDVITSNRLILVARK